MIIVSRIAVFCIMLLAIQLLGFRDLQAQCIRCNACDTGHEAPPEQPSPENSWGRGSGSHTSCWPGTCLENHGPCGSLAALSNDVGGDPATPVVKRLADVIDSRRNRKLLDLIGHYPNNLVYYAPRRSLQLLDCMGTPVANYRLTTRQMHALERVVGLRVARAN